MNRNSVHNEVSLKIEGKTYRPYLCVLITLLSTLMQVLSSSGNTANSVIVSLYLNIVIIAVAIYHIGGYGVFAATASALIFSLTIHQSVLNVAFIVVANFVQAFLMYLFFKADFRAEKSADGIVSTSKISLFILGLVYFLYNLIFGEYYVLSSAIILLLIVCVHAFHIITTRDRRNLLFLASVIVPNFIGALIGSVQFDGFALQTELYLSNLLIWLFSNAILLLSFGYILIDAFSAQKLKKYPFLTVKLSTVLFYCSTILWNVIIYALYCLGWLNKNIDSYVFPWLVGNVFFIMNLYYSFYRETDDEGATGFQWFEGRSIVAENNTQMLVAIISFLLPICAQLLGTITYSISILFIFNITAAVMSIGLIWIPKGMIRDMSTVKHVKTIFHLFTLSLLLLNVVLIINESVGL